jgi:hypothetical protein
MPIHSDSPLFVDALSWIKKKHMTRLRPFFALDPYLAYIVNIDFSTPGPAPRVISRKSTLDKHREEIRTELVEPLFDRPGLKVQYEANCWQHRKDNAYCCVEFHRKRIEKVPARDLKAALEEFRSDWKKALRGACFPFDWIIDRRDPVAKEQAELDERLARFRKEIQRRKDEAVSNRELNPIVEEWDAMEGWAEIQNKDLAWAHRLSEAGNEIKRQYILDMCKVPLLLMMEWARGKPGRHPKEFNVLVYHIIKKCTHWKFDKYHKYIMRKDGQHRLMTDWKFAMFLLLDAHVHVHEFPELTQFISRNRRTPATRALANMQIWLLNIRKNFPPLHGWPMNREGVPLPETGFRKLIVKPDGGLKGIHL